MKRFWPAASLRNTRLLCISMLLASPVTLQATQVASTAESAIAAQKDQEQPWGQWRGPLGTGEAPQASPPTRWSETENVKWKTKLPGLGHASPVVWGKRVFLASAVPTGEKFEPIADGAPGSHDNLKVDSRHQFVGLAIDRDSGEILWQKTLNTLIPHEGGHVSASLASGSPITDGKHVFFFFGSHGLYCLDMDGNLVWKKTLGKLNTKHAHGEGASPVLFENTLIVNCDHEGQSFVTALDKNTGRETWKQERDEVTSWSSPVVTTHQQRAQVIVAGTGAVRGYDLETGEIIWSCSGLSNNICATPIAYDGKVYVGSSYEIRSMLAIDLDGAQGDITNSDRVIWKRASRTPYVPSPLLYRGSLYFLRHYQEILTIARADTGDEDLGPFRLPVLRDIYASPVAADGRIYITDRDGNTLVLSEPEMPRILSANHLDDRFSASAAIVGQELFLRGEKFLYCLRESASPAKK